nr:multiple epidermal growth factor-like domains protein 10 [Crassostrea gigas]
MLTYYVSLSGITFILFVLIQSGCFVFCSECIRNKNRCCANYYRSSLNEQCKECPAGTFGLNCSRICGDNYYGRLCKEECNCTGGQYCDPVHGCLNNHSDTTEREYLAKDSIADQGIAKSFECKSEKVRCCPNYYRVNGNCTECPTGTFGLNCSSTCPSNYHGVFCKEECQCTDGQYCDSINGCIQNTGMLKLVDWFYSNIYIWKVTSILSVLHTIRRHY